MQPNMLETSNQILNYLNIKDVNLPATLLDEALDEDYSPDGETIEQRIIKHFKEDSLSSIKTVRFLKDFALYKSRPDLTTSNKTFLRVAKIFKKMGVKNYYFHLQLNNPKLLGVDPFDENLTDELKLMIFQECRENFWYFLREVCRLSGGISFRASRANISLAWCWLNHITTLLIMPRQQGKTVTSQALSFWLTYINGKANVTHIITLKDDNRQQFVDAVKGIRASIPSWLTNVSYRDKDAGNSLTYSALGEENKNKLILSVPQIGLEAARNVSRGLTTENRFVDEPAYIKWIEAILNGAGPSTLTARKKAREDRRPHGTGYITTPASRLTESGAYMYEMLMTSTEWREKYFDCFSESHLNSVLLKNSPNKDLTVPRVSMVYNYLQLGLNKDWVRKTIDELGLSKIEAKIDLLLMWNEEGKDKLLSSEVRDAINESKVGPSFSQMQEGTELYFDWYVDELEYLKILSGESNTHYLIGCDTSAAQGQDACTIVIRDIMTGYVVGTGRYQLSFLTDVGIVLTNLLSTITNSTLIIERNFASHMIDQLLVTLPALGIDPFKRIFNQIFNNPEKYENEYREIKARGFSGTDERFYLKFKQYFGFITNAETRSQVYGFLEEAVSMTGEGIRMSKLIDELMGIRVINGRLDHGNNGHDDLVIAWLLTYWFIKLAKNKGDYNIPPGIALSKVNILKIGDLRDQAIDPALEMKHNFYKAKFQEVSEKLMDADNPIIIQRYEDILKKIHSLMPAYDKRALTVDDIKRKAEEARKKRLINKKIEGTNNYFYH